MSIDLNTTRATFEPMQRWMPRPKLKCRLFFRARSIDSDRGTPRDRGWPSPGQPQAIALLELHARDLEIGGDRAAVPGAGVKKRRNSSVAEASNVSDSRLSSSRCSGFSPSHSSACAVNAVVVSKPPPMIRPSIPSSSASGAEFAVDPQSCQRVHDAGARVLADLEEVVEQVRAHRHRLLQNPWGVRGIGGSVDVGVGRLAIELPLLQRNAHQGQRQDGRHDVREIVDEVDPPGFDLLVDAGPHDLVDEWFPAFDGRRRQVGLRMLR